MMDPVDFSQKKKVVRLGTVATMNMDVIDSVGSFYEASPDPRKLSFTSMKINKQNGNIMMLRSQLLDHHTRTTESAAKAEVQ